MNKMKGENNMNKFKEYMKRVNILKENHPELTEGEAMMNVLADFDFKFYEHVKESDFNPIKFERRTMKFVNEVYEKLCSEC